MLQEYLIAGESQARTVTAGYDETGALVKVFFDGEFTDDSKRKWLYHLPLHLDDLAPFAKKVNWTVTPVEMDLSFDNFYELYGNKVAKKNAEARWKRLSREQKIKALLFIKKYDQRLKLTPGVQKQYPATYLNSEPWND